LTLHHLDVYRLESVAETLDLDLPELLESGATVIEWGDRILEVLPSDHLVVALRYPEPIEASVDTDREIEITAVGQHWRDRWDRVQSAVGSSESQ